MKLEREKEKKSSQVLLQLQPIFQTRTKSGKVAKSKKIEDQILIWITT